MLTLLPMFFCPASMTICLRPSSFLPALTAPTSPLLSLALLRCLEHWSSCCWFSTPDLK